jgi:hypothetical protein
MVRVLCLALVLACAPPDRAGDICPSGLEPVSDVCSAPSKLWIELTPDPEVESVGTECDPLDSRFVLLDRELGLLLGFAAVPCEPWSGDDSTLHTICSAVVRSEFVSILVEFELVSDWFGDGEFIARATLVGEPVASCTYRYRAQTSMIWEVP